MKPFTRFAFLLVACGTLWLQSCADHRLADADASAFGAYAEELDTALLRQYFAKAIDAVASGDSPADRVVQQRYQEAAEAEAVPLWFSERGLMDDADELLEFLRTALPENGLDTAAFSLPQIAADMEVVKTLAFDSIGQNINEVLARLDYNLSRAYVRYAVGLRFGFMQPAKVFNRLQQKPEGEWIRLYDYEVQNPDYAEAVRQLPLGSRMDFLRASEPSSALYQTLKRELAQTSDTLHRHRLAVNMERCRWLTAQPNTAQPCVLVNLPAQQLWAVGRDTVLNMRICCGATPTKTPLLHSTITHMQVNPDWLIPYNIIKNEVSGHAGDSAYFARHRYYIVDRSTADTLNPSEVSAERMRAGGLRVGQHGGVGNSLGRIVFRFPNNFSVYLHDTNMRGVFQQERRTVSHGCIRVQKPFELAQFLLPSADEWTLERLRISMDLSVTSERGRKWIREHANEPRPFRLVKYQGVSPSVPIFILYYTAYPSPESGAVEYWPDLYGYDAVITRHAPVI